MKIVNCKLIIGLCFLLFFFVPKSVSAAVLTKQKTIVRPNIIVSATIGIPKMTIWGYSSPSSIVELSGVGVDQKTNSDSKGYYSFELVYLIDSPTFPELCLTVVDGEGRTTPPTCIPAIQSGNYFYSVGPVILPPTISVGAPQTHTDSQVSAQGSTIPNSQIEIKLAKPDVKKNIFSYLPVARVLAYYIPDYTVTSDAEGKYSFNMPTNQGTSWRVFAVTDFEGANKSPKSNTLKFEILTPLATTWQSLWQFLKTFLYWPRIIVLELLLILILVAVAFVVLGRKRKNDKKSGNKKVDQKYSKLVEKYQEFLNRKKLLNP